MIGGEIKATQDFAKYVGIFKGKIVAINPTRQQLNKLIGGEEEKEIEYLGEKEGIDIVKITFWLKVEGKDNLHIPISFNLKNEIRYNKDKTKIQLINQIGDSQWVEIKEDGSWDESKLFNSFKSWTKVTQWELNGVEIDRWESGAKAKTEDILERKEFRPAIVGEEKLLQFVKTWLGDINYGKVSANIFLDNKKFFVGNFKELQGQIGGDYSRKNKDSVAALAFVSVDKDDNEKFYQRVYSTVLPAYLYKNLNNGEDKLSGNTVKLWNKFKKEVEGEYGIDGFITYETLREYDPKEDLCTTSGNQGEVEDTDDNY